VQRRRPVFILPGGGRFCARRSRKNRRRGSVGRMEKKNRVTKYYIYLFLTVLIWGTGFAGTKIALNAGVPPGLVVALRMAFGAAFLLAIFFRKVKRLSGRQVRYGVVAGLLLGGGSVFHAVGMSFTNVSTNAFITATYVVFVPVLCRIFLKNRISWQVVVSVVCVVAGMAVLTNVFETGFRLNIGDLLTLAGAVLVAGQIVYIGYAAADMESGPFTFIQLCTSCAVSLVYFWAVETPIFITPDFHYGLLMTVYLGIVYTAVAFYLQCTAQLYISPSKTAIILSLESVAASFFSVMIGLEGMTPSMVVGGMMIMVAVFLSQVRSKKAGESG